MAHTTNTTNTTNTMVRGAAVVALLGAVYISLVALNMAVWAAIWATASMALNDAGFGQAFHQVWGTWWAIAGSCVGVLCRAAHNVALDTAKKKQATQLWR